MKYFSVLISLLISFKSYSQGLIVRDFMPIDESRIKTYNLETLEENKVITPNKSLRKTNYLITEGEVVPMQFGFGYEEAQFQKKNGIFSNSKTAYFSVSRRNKFYDNLGYNLDGYISKNTLILKQGLYYSLKNLLKLDIYPLLEVGQKINLEEQIDSGFLFFNWGAGMTYSLDKLDLYGKVYKTFSQKSSLGFEFKTLYPLDEFRVGISLGVDYYESTDAEFKRDGQRSFRMGLLFQY